MSPSPRKSSLRLLGRSSSSSVSTCASSKSTTAKQKKQLLFARNRNDAIPVRTERSTQSELEDLTMSETEGNHSAFEDEDYDAFPDKEYAGSSSTSMTASLSGSLSQSGLSSQDSLASSMKRNLEKSWMRESDSGQFISDDLFDLVEEEDEDDDEDESAMSSIFMSVRNLGAKSKSVAADLSIDPGETAQQRLTTKASPEDTKRIRRAVRNLHNRKNCSLSKTTFYISKLRELSADDEGTQRSEISKHGGIEAIISSLRRFLSYDKPENESKEEDNELEPVYVLRLQQLGIATLANLARLSVLDSKIAKSGGIVTVFDAMKKYPGNSNLQEKGLDFVGTLARLEEGRANLMRNNDTIKIILSAMNQCSDDIYVQRRACIALYRLSAEGSDSCTIIGKSGAIQETLNSMKDNPKDAKLQKLGCAVLKALSRREEANKTQIVAKGGLVLVLNAMTLHEDDSGVQEEGCRFFGHMSMSHVERKFSIARSGALERILKAMKQHESARVQIAGCVALVNLTSKLEIAQKANGHGAVSIVKAAKPHARQDVSKILTRLRLARYAPIVFI